MVETGARLAASLPGGAGWRPVFMNWVSAEVISVDYEGIVREGRELVKIHENIVVKVPLIAEGIKAVEDLLAPVSGVVEARNEAVLASPEELQNDPYGEGWLLLVRPSNPGEADALMDAAAYRAKVQA